MVSAEQKEVSVLERETKPHTIKEGLPGIIMDIWSGHAEVYCPRHIADASRNYERHHVPEYCFDGVFPEVKRRMMVRLYCSNGTYAVESFDERKPSPEEERIKDALFSWADTY